jgi:MIP family channel proteins
LVAIALAHGLALAIMVTAFGHISGGHFNPAVTVAAFVGRQIDILHGVLYIIAQLAAAVLAGFALRAVFPTDVWQSVNLGTPAVAADISFGTAVLIEAILTFILVIAVFGTAMDPRAAKVGGFAIGLTISADILIGGPLTGASMNPARTFGPAVAANFWDNHLVYWIGPLCGAIIAGLVYGWYLMDKKQDEEAA